MFAAEQTFGQLLATACNDAPAPPSHHHSLCICGDMPGGGLAAELEALLQWLVRGTFARADWAAAVDLTNRIRDDANAWVMQDDHCEAEAAALRRWAWQCC